MANLRVNLDKIEWFSIRYPIHTVLSGEDIVQVRYNHRYFEPDHRRSNMHRRRVNIERKGEGGEGKGREGKKAMEIDFILGHGSSTIDI